MSIAITRDLTSFDDYMATVQDETPDTWRFQFSPDCCELGKGDYKTEIYYVRGVEWPALLLTDRLRYSVSSLYPGKGKKEFKRLGRT